MNLSEIIVKVTANLSTFFCNFYSPTFTLSLLLTIVSLKAIHKPCYMFILARLLPNSYQPPWEHWHATIQIDHLLSFFLQTSYVSSHPHSHFQGLFHLTLPLDNCDNPYHPLSVLSLPVSHQSTFPPVYPPVMPLSSHSKSAADHPLV